MNARRMSGSATLGIFNVLLGVTALVSLSCGGRGNSTPATAQGSGGEGALGGQATAGAPNGTAGSTAGAAACVRSAEDLPDNAFADTNCDGIDGDVAAAIFVAPSGSDSAPGTMTEPVKSINHGIQLAAASFKSVYVCNGTYAESVTLDGQAVSLYGGYDCADGWKRSNTARAEVASPTNRALAIKDVTGKVVIDRIDFAASSATQPGSSSVAAFVVGSGDVTLSHSNLTAGDGAAGIAGDPVPGNYVYTEAELAARTPMTGSGTALGPCSLATPCTLTNPGGDRLAFCGTNCAAATCLSNGATTSGGKGGQGGNLGKNVAATRGQPGVPPGPGAGGSNGPAGSDSAPGANAMLGFGSVDATGYLPTNHGEHGQPGGMGQAGTGGDGDTGYQLSSGDIFFPYYVVGGGGGEGGPGGCGGWGGKGGGGGGASIALLIVDSTVSISNGTYKTGRGGRGGLPSVGGLGAEGTAGALGGSSTCDCDPVRTPSCGSSVCPTARAQSGGKGGPGGKGGDGGPGAGGPSIPLVVTGPAPTSSGITCLPGSGGLGASAPNGAKAVDGLVQDRWFRSAPTTSDGGTDGGTIVDGSIG
jgi:hypothetical protein